MTGGRWLSARFGPVRRRGRGRPAALGRRPAAAFRKQGGAAPIELVAGLGLLVLPVVILVVSLPVWAEVRSMGTVAAQQAARTIVTAPEPTAAYPAAAAVAEAVAANFGRELVGAPRVAWFHRADAAGTAGSGAQEVVTVTVTVRLPAITVPLIGSWGAVDWDVRHAEAVDRYRSRP